MPQSNLAEKFPVAGEPEPKEQPRLKLVIRDSVSKDPSGEEKNWLADHMDSLIMTLALTAGIVGYTVFGILVAASGR
jgi:hypothetical protein